MPFSIHLVLVRGLQKLTTRRTADRASTPSISCERAFVTSGHCGSGHAFLQALQ